MGEWRPLDRLQRFFQRGQPQALLRDWEQIHGGWETDLYAFTLEPGPPGQATRLVIRLFRGPGRRARAAAEYRTLRAVHRLGIPVPRVHRLVLDDSPLADPFLVMDHIQGPSLAQRLQAGTPAERDGLIEQMAATLLQVHRLDWRELFPDSVDRESDPLAYVDSLLAQMRTTCARAALTDFDPLLRWLEDRRAQGASDRTVVLHNDYHPENILMEGGHLIVLDWSFAAPGDYRMDLAWSVLLMGTLLGEGRRLELLQAYERLDSLPAPNFEYFEALKLGMRMVTIGSWLDESTAIPVYKISREAIRGEYKVHVLNPYRRLKQITQIPLPRIEAL